MNLNLGLFLMPMTAPETPIYDATERSLEMIRFADEIGFAEAWIGEHYTSLWEKVPSPDILIAQALKQTKNIKLAAGAHLLPYHHPVELAHRIAYLDHLAQGRLMLGVGTGVIDYDRDLFGIESAAEQRERAAEALEIMITLWTEEDFDYKGKYWSTKRPKTVDERHFGYHITPYQKPHMPIGVAGMSMDSSTLVLAGKHGFMPMSLLATPEVLNNHWNSVLKGAAMSGKKPKREDWRVVYHVLIADTDEEAYDLAINGFMGQSFAEYNMPFLGPIMDRFKISPDTKTEEITVEYLAKNDFWLVGSTETVAKKLKRVYEKSGGFGTLLVNHFDYEDTNVFYKTMKLLKEEVVPRLGLNKTTV